MNGLDEDMEHAIITEYTQQQMTRRGITELQVRRVLRQREKFRPFVPGELSYMV